MPSSLLKFLTVLPLMGILLSAQAVSYEYRVSTRGLVATPSVPISSLPTMTPATLDFGSVPVNTSAAPRTVTLTNNQSTAIAVSGIATGSTLFTQTNNCGTTLAANASCQINIGFNPVAQTTQTAALTVTAGQTPITTTITGKGVATSLEVRVGGVLQSGYDYGQIGVGATSSGVAFAIKNVSGAVVTFGPLKVFVAAPFARTATTCGATLAVNSSCTATITFTPSAVQSYSGTLSIDSNAPAYTPLPLRGQGLAQPVSGWQLAAYPATLQTAISDLSYNNGVYAATGDGVRFNVGTSLQTLHSIYGATGGGLWAAVVPFKSFWITSENGYNMLYTWSGITGATVSGAPASYTGNRINSGGYPVLETDGVRVVSGSVGNNSSSSMVTTDGITWAGWSGNNTPYLNVSGGGYGNVTAIHHAGSTWVAAGSSTDISVSTDSGVTWTTRGISGVSLNSYEFVSSVDYGAGLWAMTTTAGRILTSPDTLNWTARTPPTAGAYLWSIAYGPGGFVAVGSAGKITTSTNGIDWALSPNAFGTSATLNKVKYLNGQWVILSSTLQFGIGVP